MVVLTNKIFPFLIITVIAVMLYYVSAVNYLLFHCVVEFSGIAIALSLFLIAWNVKGRTDNCSLVYLGIAYFFVSVLNMAHTLSYKGMHIFDYDYYASDLWIAARYMASISLFIFFAFPNIKRRISYESVWVIYFCATSILLASIYYWKIFPVCFIEGTGQTHFKLYSEYVICGILIVSLLLLHNNRNFFDKTILRFLYWSVCFTVASEISFSLYKEIFGFFNFIGHIFMLVSFYLIYKAIIENSLRQPFNLIFKELKEKEDLLNLSQKIARLGSWEYDLTADRMIWTDEAYRIRELPLGYEANFEQALKFYTENSALRFRETFQRLVNEGGADDLELEMITAKNRKIWVRVTFAAQRENGKTIRISGIIQDISEYKKAEELREDFERIKRHDLKSPLNSIFMVSQLLNSKKISEDEIKKIAGIIQDSACNLLNMINLSLNLYRIEEGAYKLVSGTFDLTGLMKRIVNDHTLNMKSKKISLLSTVNGIPLDDAVGVFEVNGDETLMYSMFSNLLKNAIEASPFDDNVEIKIKGDSEKYTVEFKNNGLVPTELKETFFNKYATAGKKDGTGLGTYSARLIAELHSGKISMTSSDGIGTSVIIELPQFGSGVIGSGVRPE